MSRRRRISARNRIREVVERLDAMERESLASTLRRIERKLDELLVLIRKCEPCRSR